MTPSSQFFTYICGGGFFVGMTGVALIVGVDKYESYALPIFATLAIFGLLSAWWTYRRDLAHHRELEYRKKLINDYRLYFKVLETKCIEDGLFESIKSLHDYTIQEADKCRKGGSE